MLVTRGVAIFTDAVRVLLRREMEAKYGPEWWGVGVWPYLSPTQRKFVAESQASDRHRAPQDLLDANHFRAVVVDPDVNYSIFQSYLPERAQARRAFETVRRTKNLLVSHRRSGDSSVGEAKAGLRAMHLILQHADSSAAVAIADLLHQLDPRDTAHDAGTPAPECVACAEPLPAHAIVIERGNPRHADTAEYARACTAVFGAPLCVNHLRTLDGSAAVVAARVVGHNRGGLIVDINGLEGFVPRRHTLALRSSLLSEADAEAMLARQRGRAIRLQAVDSGDGRRPVYREVHPDESVVVDLDRGRLARALRFPNDRSLGLLRIYPHRPLDMSEAHEERPARGGVLVVVSSYVCLAVEPSADLAPLDALDKDALQRIELERQATADEALGHIAQLVELEELIVRSLGATERVLADAVASLARLRSLDVRDTPFEGSLVLSRLSACGALEDLSLAETRIGDAATRHLSECSGLGTLNLRSTRITNTGLADVARASQLRSLCVADTVISVAGVAHLASLPALERLDVSGTAVSAADILTMDGFPKLQWLSAADSTAVNVEADRKRRDRSGGSTPFTRGEFDGAASPPLLEVLVLLLISMPFAIPILLSLLGVTYSGTLGWVVVALAPIVAWICMPERPARRELLWVGSVLAVFVISSTLVWVWRPTPLDQLDPNGPSALLVGAGAILLSLGWPIYRSRPSRLELVVVAALLCIALLLASPDHWPPAQAIASAWQHYRLEQIATFVCAMAWLWCAWAALRLGWRRVRKRQLARGRHFAAS
jgi:hypothetical protein